MFLLPPEPKPEDIRAAGGALEPHPVAVFFHGSGAIARQTAYETGLAGHHKGHGAAHPETVRDLRDFKERIAPRLVAPGHCTGWRAKAALASAFAPGRYAPRVVGSVDRLDAAAGG